MNQKHFLKSETIWAGLLNLISWITLFFVSKDLGSKHTALIGIFTTIGTFTNIFVFHGRFKANSKLYIKKKSE